MVNKPDVYGSLGAQAAPSWTAQLARMSYDELESCFVAAAERTSLSLNQMEQLIQDIPPETSSWPHPRTWLLDSVSAISELRFAIACGQLGPVVTPSQFLAWCERHVVDLHFAFCQRVKTLNAPPVTAVPMGPAWAPLGGMAAKVMTRKRGRPKVAIGNDASLIKAAHDLLMSHAVTGRALTRDEVASALHGSESAGTLSAASIRRRLSGKLNLEYTKALATQVNARNNRGV